MDFVIDGLSDDVLGGHPAPVLTIVEWLDDVSIDPSLVLCTAEGAGLHALLMAKPPINLTSYLRWAGFEADVQRRARGVPRTRSGQPVGMPPRPSGELRDERRCAVIRAVADAHEAGCPVAGRDQGQWEQTADVAIRRWDSIARRRKRFVYADRVEDLAKGLRDRFERDPKLVGPLMEDYRYLASRIAEALSARP